MKNCLWLLFIMPCLYLHSQDNSTLSKLEATYKGYMVACDKGKGKKAFGYLDHNSKVYFELMLNDLWYADSMTLEKLPMDERLLILIIRQINAHEKLESFNPQSFAVYVLGEVAPPGLYTREGYTLGELREEENMAYARLMVNGNPVDPEFIFTKENGHWKMSLIPFLQDATSHITARLKKSNTAEKEFNLFMIESFSNEPISPDIWKPTKK
jgi:hypothetical protein